MSCSEAAEQGGEPLLGSAATCTELVLVSWPKGEWEPNALDTPGLPRGLRPWKKERNAAGGRTVVRLGSKPGTSVDALVAMGWPSCWRAESVLPRNLLTGMDAAIEAVAAGHEGARVDKPVLVVCAHGNHDACCALHGAHFAQRARKAATRLGIDLEVWESSHLGGHRFAATAITLPWGHMHGRLGLGDAETMVEHAVAGRPWLERFRGNIFLDEARQVAEGAALEWAAERGVDGRAFVGPLRDGTVAITVGGHELVVCLGERTFQTLKSCNEASDGTLEVSRLVAESITEL